MMRNLSLSLFVLLLSMVSFGDVAFSQGRHGTPSEEAACRGDARRHCRKVLDQGDIAVFNCLQENKSKLTRACRKVVEENGG